LPRESELNILQPNGDTSIARTTYSACHEYRAQSSIRFDDDPSSASTQKKADPASPLPAAIHFTARTTVPLDFAALAAGDRITARDPETSDKKIWREGPLVSGRIAAARHLISVARMQLVVALDTAVTGGAQNRIFAIRAPAKVASSPGYGMRSRGVPVDIPLP